MNNFQNWWKDARNRVDYSLRNLLRWQRRGLKFSGQPKQAVFDYLEPDKRIQAWESEALMRQMYHLEQFRDCATAINYRENLFYLHLLEGAFQRAQLVLPREIQVVDIGPAHWFYVQALYAGLTWYQTTQARDVRLSGYEADAYHLFSNLHSRFDYARAHIRSLPVEYIPHEFIEQPGAYDLVCMFFPFVFLRDHLLWGIPRRNFDPLMLRKIAWNSVKPGGWWLLVNQGEAEHQAELELLAQLGIHPQIAYRHQSLLYPYRLERFVILVQHA
ncbi:MAG: hypothetical protein CVU39_28290 [Chloroflexi bacterium HGW-Chloroflexi-10]|nr:MAG: hypothetical protein CVU39_28290 [Chloroflexi bacterium HGW-Chloroflexi-10]